MTVAVKAISQGFDFIEPVSETLDMGARFELVVAVPDTQIDLSQATYRIFDGASVWADGQLGAIETPDPNPDLYDPRNGPVDLRPRVRLSVVAPSLPGHFDWRLVVPAQKIGAVEIDGASLAFGFTTTQHRTSLAAWDVPSPVCAGDRFRIRLGAKCSAGCTLHGLSLVALDASGMACGTAALGATCWPEADGLYWCEMEIEAPETEGLHEALISFKPEGLGLPHRGAATSISFVVTPTAAHHVHITLRDGETGLPIAGAQVRFGPHRKATDDSGCVRFDVASGPHRLFIWKANFEFAESTHDVQQDLELTVEGRELPKPSPYARWEG